MTNSTADQHSPAAVLFLPTAYFLCYVIIHVLQILFLEAKSVDLRLLLEGTFLEKFHSSLLSALTVGLCSSLLMLSLATALRFRLGELAMAAPASLFRIFSIFLIGQTLILIAGHSAIFAAALSTQEQSNEELANIYKAGTEYVVVFTVFVAVASLWLLETYLHRVYQRLAHVFPSRSLSARKHTKILASLALFSLALIVLKIFLPASSVRIDGPTVSLMVAIFELLVFIATIYVSLARDK
jgi:hypothetical protein